MCVVTVLQKHRDQLQDELAQLQQAREHESSQMKVGTLSLDPNNIKHDIQQDRLKEAQTKEQDLEAKLLQLEEESNEAHGSAIETHNTLKVVTCY